MIYINYTSSYNNKQLFCLLLTLVFPVSSCLSSCQSVQSVAVKWREFQTTNKLEQLSWPTYHYPNYHYLHLPIIIPTYHSPTTTIPIYLSSSPHTTISTSSTTLWICITQPNPAQMMDLYSKMTIYTVWGPTAIDEHNTTNIPWKAPTWASNTRPAWHGSDKPHSTKPEDMSWNKKSCTVHHAICRQGGTPSGKPLPPLLLVLAWCCPRNKLQEHRPHFWQQPTPPHYSDETWTRKWAGVCVCVWQRDAGMNLLNHTKTENKHTLFGISKRMLPLLTQPDSTLPKTTMPMSWLRRKRMRRRVSS